MKKNFLLLFLMALLPLAGWGQIGFKVGNTGDIIASGGSTPFAEGITLYSYEGETNVNCNWYFSSTGEDGSYGYIGSDFNTYMPASNPGFYKAVKVNYPGDESETDVFGIIEVGNVSQTPAGKIVVSINHGQMHKTYGDPDPSDYTKFKFVIRESSDPNVTTEDIAPYLVFKRATGHAGEDVGNYHYYYDFTAAYNSDDCPYEIVPLETEGNLIVDPAPLKINVTNYWKEFLDADPAFEWTIVNEEGNVLRNGDETVDITITREAGEAVNATLANGVAVLNQGQNGYAFIGKAQNYVISFDNAFAIVPTDNIDNVTVTVENNAVQGKPAAYEYEAREFKPGTVDTPEYADLVVTDRGYTLVNGVDYVVKEYKDNIHVTCDADGKEIAGATVTITLKGSYSGGEASGKFTILKAPLAISANDVELQLGDAEPTEFTVSYEGWKGNDWYETSGDTKVKAKGFKAPSGVTKVQIPGSTAFELVVIEDAEADDYVISYEKGVMSYGQTTLHVWAVRQSKVYGEKDPAEFEVKVTTNNRFNGNVATATQKAALTIGGKKVYTLTRAAGENVLLGGLLGYNLSFDGPSVLPNNVLVQYHDGTNLNGRAFYITPATLTITADNKEKFYGEDDPEFTVTVTGLAEGDTESVLNAIGGGKIYTVSAGNHSENVGEYPIHVAQRSGVISTLQNFFDNYNINYVDGKLTIKKAPIIVTVDDEELSYGQRYTPSYSIALDESVNATLTNAQRNAITNALRNIQYDITPAPTATPIPVGEYTVAVKNGPTEINNYTITYVAGTLKVGKRLLGVVAKDQGINIGGSIDPYNVEVYTYNGYYWTNLNWSKEQIEKVLYLSTEHTAIGVYKNAYTLNEVENASYTVDAENAFTNAWLTIGGLEVIPLGAQALADLLGVENTPTLLSEVLEAHKGLTVSFILPNRKMDANEWYAWVFPFDIKPSDMLDQVTVVNGEPKAEVKWGYTVMEVLNLDKSKNGRVHFEPEVQLIPANTPFIVKPERNITAAQNEQVIIHNVTIPAKNAAGEEIFYFDTENNKPVDAEVITADGSLKFVGVYSDNSEILKDESILYLAKASGHQHREFWPGGGEAIEAAIAKGAKLERTNAYLQYLNGNAREVQIFIEEPDGTVTSIKGVETNVDNNVEGVYNLNGMKLQGAPAQKGIYIQDGKKVVIK